MIEGSGCFGIESTRQRWVNCGQPAAEGVSGNHAFHSDFESRSARPGSRTSGVARCHRPGMIAAADPSLIPAFFVRNPSRPTRFTNCPCSSWPSLREFSSWSSG